MGYITTKRVGVLMLNDELLSHKVQIERKFFYFHLKENPRGRFLKITEDVGGRRDTIIIPSTGLEAFRDAIQLAVDRDREAGPVETPE
jgi:hypothetical protein